MVIVRVVFCEQRMVLYRGLPDDLVILCPLIDLIFDPPDHLVTLFVVPRIVAGVVVQLLKVLKLWPQHHFFFGDPFGNLLQRLVCRESRIAAQEKTGVNHQEANFVTFVIDFDLASKIVVRNVPLALVLELVKPRLLVVVAVVIASDCEDG